MSSDVPDMEFTDWVEVAAILHHLAPTERDRLLNLWGFTEDEYSSADDRWTGVLMGDLASGRRDRPEAYAAACVQAHAGGPSFAQQRLEEILARPRKLQLPPPVPAASAMEQDETIAPVPSHARGPALPFGRVRSAEFLADLARPAPPPPPPSAVSTGEETLIVKPAQEMDQTLPFAKPTRGDKRS
jgi:hypothetical protein